MTEKIDSSLIDELLTKSRTFENDIFDNLKKSKRLAWTIGSIFFVYSLMLTISITFLLPLKQTQPYVIRIDNNTGYTDIIPSLTDQSFTTEEALDRFWIANYVELREKYVYETLQNDYERVQIFGSTNVNNMYVDYFKSDHAPYKLYGADNTIEVKILSINLGTSDGETLTKIANVRAELTKINLLTKEKNSKRIFATISYDYNPDISFLLNQRTMNPLGFQVLSYTVDTERL